MLSEEQKTIVLDLRGKEDRLLNLAKLEARTIAHSTFRT